MPLDQVLIIAASANPAIRRPSRTFSDHLNVRPLPGAASPVAGALYFDSPPRFAYWNMKRLSRTSMAIATISPAESKLPPG